MCWLMASVVNDCSLGLMIVQQECSCGAVGRAEQGSLGCILAYTQVEKLILHDYDSELPSG